MVNSSNDWTGHTEEKIDHHFFFLLSNDTARLETAIMSEYNSRNREQNYQEVSLSLSSRFKAPKKVFLFNEYDFEMSISWFISDVKHVPTNTTMPLSNCGVPKPQTTFYINWLWKRTTLLEKFLLIIYKKREKKNQINNIRTPFHYKLRASCCPSWSWITDV